jgi:hypothetical protein
MTMGEGLIGDLWQRPGHAGVQYDDVRGEAAADISDRLGAHNLQDAARELGFKGPGRVVGISIYGGDELRRDPNLVGVAVQAMVDAPGGVDAINQALTESDGVLDVVEYYKTGVPIIDFMRCCKRLNVSLFSKNIKAREVRVSDAEEL